MGGGTDPAPKGQLHLAREADNVHQLRRVFIVLEAPVRPSDTFNLEKKGLSPAAHRIKLPGKQVVVEIAPISDSPAAHYTLVHYRDSSVRDVFDYVKLAGSLINSPKWHGVAPPNPPTESHKIRPPRVGVDPPGDRLLHEDVTDFKKVRADEPGAA